jgi:hypothetical protein
MSFMKTLFGVEESPTREQSTSFPEAARKGHLEKMNTLLKDNPEDESSLWNVLEGVGCALTCPLFLIHS